MAILGRVLRFAIQLEWSVCCVTVIWSSLCWWCVLYYYNSNLTPWGFPFNRWFLRISCINFSLGVALLCWFIFTQKHFQSMGIPGKYQTSSALLIIILFSWANHLGMSSPGTCILLLMQSYSLGFFFPSNSWYPKLVASAIYWTWPCIVLWSIFTLNHFLSRSLGNLISFAKIYISSCIFEG